MTSDGTFVQPVKTIIQCEVTFTYHQIIQLKGWFTYHQIFIQSEGWFTCHHITIHLKGRCTLWREVVIKEGEDL